MNTLVQIAAQLPPAMDGVGDYAWLLWKHWPEANTHFKFVVLHGAERTRAKEAADLTAIQPKAHALRDALERSGAQTVLLHYVGYAYQPKGMPLWLPPALEQWRSEGRARHLVTMFHEMYATSSPLRSPYWVKPFARRVMQRLVNTSDAWVTSCSRYFDWLVNEFHAPGERGALLPIAANVPTAPEADEERLWPLEFGRRLRVVVFGLPRTRLDAVERHAGLLHAMVHAGLVESILLLGKGDFSRRYARRANAVQERIGGVWRSECDLPASQVAEALAECDVGLVANEAGTLTKSGVFAALASNAVVAVASGRDATPLAAPYDESVLLNDDTESGIAALLGTLNRSNEMAARRRQTRELARSELAWPRLAARWSHIVGGLPDAPARRPVASSASAARETAWRTEARA